ncbi:MAG: 50S ribosome-binding GTPase [Synergistaceae bacterium]|nr:50S ribosome-binding GTPase [Synergistaceae bacterium]MBQ6434938.1 50S ribosome-binding GTPase [Synergistaceae bacterium]MBQ6736914.1 50S ribosome-binding GTPase [Synergistaceae bacterium]MBQ7069352.1 50S ribosome-binding GTPase [Synergistaceae bacterium]MBR0080342.1 50S ribosome-binding GTPase [Synergistaceae bacterium]
MAKGTRKLNELVSKLDIILEVRDSRSPASTSSPLIKSLSKIKPVIHVLSRKDLADPDKLNLWLKELKHTFAADLRKREGINAIKKAILKFKPEHREVRLAVVGIPNVGKSLLLNSLIGKSNASVGNIPGITKSVSWYRNEGMLIVDSPGILDSHSEEGVHLILSWLGCAKAEVVGGFEKSAIELIKFLCSKGFQEFIPVEVTENLLPESILELIGKKYGCLISGGRVDFELAGRKFIEAFSTGRLGKICLEVPHGERVIDFSVKNVGAVEID